MLPRQAHGGEFGNLIADHVSFLVCTFFLSLVLLQSFRWHCSWLVQLTLYLLPGLPFDCNCVLQFDCPQFPRPQATLSLTIGHFSTWRQKKIYQKICNNPHPPFNTYRIAQNSGDTRAPSATVRATWLWRNSVCISHRLYNMRFTIVSLFSVLANAVHF